MAIEFRCPQNHRLSCPDDRAGKIGKCPKCGSTFVVPSAEVAASVAGLGSGAAVAASDSGSMPAETASGVAHGSSGQTDVIVFLCPNGHKLNCPPSMQGKAGKCPHCGARFVIPHYDELPPEQEYLDENEDEESLGEEDLEQEELESEGHDEDDEGSEDDVEVEVEAASGSAPHVPELPPDFLERLTGGHSAASTAAPVASAAAPAALAEEFRELWQYRARGFVVSLHMRSGAAVSPDRYAASASDNQVAIFAVKDGDGAYTVTAVAWDQVERISVQGLKFLPDELFQ